MCKGDVTEDNRGISPQHPDPLWGQLSLLFGGTENSSPYVKQAERETEYLPRSRAQVTKACSCYLHSHMVWCLIKSTGQKYWGLRFRALGHVILDASCNIPVIHYLAYFSSSWKSRLVMCLPICLMRVPISDLVQLDRFSRICVWIFATRDHPKIILSFNLLQSIITITTNRESELLQNVSFITIN